MKRKTKAKVIDAGDEKTHQRLESGGDAAEPKSEPVSREPDPSQVANETASAADTEGAAGRSEPTVEGLQAIIAELEDKLLRDKAEFANMQRRLSNERNEAIRFANEAMMKTLLPVVDDFERSLAAAAVVDDVKTVVEGTRLVYENLMKALHDQGLSAIEAQNEPFDPTLHQALMQQTSADRPGGIVLEETAKGYKFKDRVIRPTKVIVSKEAEPKEDDESAS